MTERLLELEHLHVHYGGVKALDGVTVSIDEGEIVALMGPNGAGKSTVLKAAFGLAPIERGTVRWRGNDIIPRSEECAERGIAFVPQGRRVFRHLSVRENLELGGWNVKNQKELAERVEEALDIFPVLRERLTAASGTLSGGQQQMVALARGLVADPKLLLLDEPSLGLAPKVVAEVFSKIKEINERRRIAIVVVEHNLKSLLALATRAYILNRGRVQNEGAPQALVSAGELERAFLAA